MKFLPILLVACCCTSLSSEYHATVPADPIEPSGPPVPTLVRGLEQDTVCTAWVDSVMETLDLRGRIGQLMVFTIAPTVDQPTRALLRRVVTECRVGGLLFSGGRLENQVTLTNEAQAMAKVPLMITFDGEWGLAMRLKGTPSYPRNRVLGCITHDELLREYGREVARQCREIGVTVNFAPVADVDINPANPVINTRSFGDDPQRVAHQVVAYATGLEEGGVLSVCKHFPGHGDTDTDSHLALPLLPFTRERLDTVELVPFRAAISAGLGGIMVGHLEVPALEPTPGRPTSLSAWAVDSLLHDEMGFSGLTFTDALAMKGVGTASSLCLEALKAGNDVLLAPQNIEHELNAVVAAVESGSLSADLVEEKCRKVLKYKYALGLSTKPSEPLNGARVITPEAKHLATRLKLAAVTVLQNGGMLPLGTGEEEKETIGQTDGGTADSFTSGSAHGSTNDSSSASSTTCKPKEIALLVIGQTPEAQVLKETLSGQLPVVTYSLTAKASAQSRKQLLDKLRKHDRIVVSITSKRLEGVSSLLNELKSDAALTYLLFIGARDIAPLADVLPRANAVVLAHSAEADVQRHVARIVLGQATADGRLSVSIPDLYPTGAGVTIIGSEQTGNHDDVVILTTTQKRGSVAPTANESLLAAYSARDMSHTPLSYDDLYAPSDWDDPLSHGRGPCLPTFYACTTHVVEHPTASKPHGLDLEKLTLIDSIALEGIRAGAYPGCQVVVLKDGVEVYCKAFGTQTWSGEQATHVPNEGSVASNPSAGSAATGRPQSLQPQPVLPTDVYDLASLTKITATLLAVMKLYDKGRLKLNDRVSDHLTWLKGTDKQAISIRQLLLHESGLPASLLFYERAIDKDSYTGPLFRATRDARHPVRVGAKTWANPKFHFVKGLTSPICQGDYTLQVSDSLWLHRSFRDSCRKQIIDAPMRDKRYRYSDVGFILLQQVVETITGQRLDEYVAREFYRPMGLTHTGYRPLLRLPRETIVPSSTDRFLRKTSLRGYVHDEAAAFWGGGVSGNAGLFSNAHEVARLCQMVLAGGELDGRRYLSEQTIRTFTTTLSARSRRALGYDKPDRQNPAKSPCCASAPTSVFGHTGFTGTCAWMDPDNGLVYVFLSNRIWPDVWNGRLMSLDIRPRIQEAIYAALATN